MDLFGHDVEHSARDSCGPLTLFILISIFSIPLIAQIGIDEDLDFEAKKHFIAELFLCIINRYLE